ncbi:alpha/beta fold hydrolase [Paenibacillus nasutitermitis]|uniref:Alpha/beta hydrolase n=1 Tax=Paenibacillus nasutitermitis TaxID=1652958 RepID=A0A916YY90_9BACL|nr:alpha/beta fold hydrolase [Paenibacillus nasutitermitis]GGD67044.1 alpha/beta hydrolase [Paenibacillus nasutitermitis]
MRSTHHQLPVERIHLYKWEPDEGEEVTGIIHLVHGSCEHARRYEHFARYLTDHGLIVYASDLRGHGWSVNKREELGFFGERDGWVGMVEDLRHVTALARAEHPDLKVMLIGHSMGSFLARHYAIVAGEELDGLVLIGTAHQPRILLHLARGIAKWIIRSKGIMYRSHFLNKLSYESFNRKFQPARTMQDWISRDEGEVDRFISDEQCGFVFTAGGFRDMFEGLLFITKTANVLHTPRDLPVALLSGQDDPVGSFGKTVNKACHCYRKAGVKQVELTLYDGMRHEILNEIGREQVYSDILKWLYDRVLKPVRQTVHPSSS